MIRKPTIERMISKKSQSIDFMVELTMKDGTQKIIGKLFAIIEEEMKFGEDIITMQYNTNHCTSQANIFNTLYNINYFIFYI